MTTPRVSFAAPPPSEAADSSSVRSMEVLDESKSSLNPAARAIFESLAHLVIAPERLTFVDSDTIPYGRRSVVYFAKLDETSQTPKDVAVERLGRSLLWGKERRAIRLARQLKVWEGLKHPNVLELIGYYLSPNYDIAQLVSPYMINGSVREYLQLTSAGIAKRLRFVRDITAGLDYLHNQSPPICHGDLTPGNVTIDENFNAVLSSFGLAGPADSDLDDPSGLTISLLRVRTLQYMGPEFLLEEQAKQSVASDIWSWGCTVFEILTGTAPFHEQINDIWVLRSLLNRSPPGAAEILLQLVPDVPRPEHAASLRILHSYIPLCWEYEPRKRPSISLVRQKAFMFWFEGDAGESVVATLEELAHLLIPPERLRLLERSLGSGNYGEVVLGTLDETSSTPRDVAVKRLKAVGTQGERVRLAKRLARELNVWAKIKHPNVVELIGYYLDEKYESPLLISALMANGDVLAYIERFKPDIQQRIAFTKGITAGLACLHNFDPAISHADLKPANVLIDLHMNAVLCDFGLASFVGDSPTAPGLVTTTALKGGTPRYMSPELHLDDDCTHSLESDVWAWACTVFHVLTGTIPYAKALGERQLCMAIVQEQPPGDITLLLPNNFEGADPESALALRFLHSVIPKCWDFEPRRRPSMSTLLSQMSNLSSETVDVAGENEGGRIGGLSDGATFVEAPEIPSGDADQDGVAREGNQDLLENDNLQAEEAIEENVWVDNEETQAKGGTHGDEPSNDLHAHTHDKQPVEETVNAGQDGIGLEEGSSDNEQNTAGHGVTGDKVADIVADQPSTKVSSPAFGPNMLGIACILALLSAVAYQSLQISYSSPPPGPVTSHPDHAPDKISSQPLSAIIWPAAFILSIFANIYLVLRKADSPPSRDREKPATSTLERG